MTTPFASHCARCGRPAPSEESKEFLEWEAWDEGLMVVCPDCITAEEPQAMDEQMMDEHRDEYPLVTGMDGRAIDVAPAENELVRLSIDMSTFIDLTPSGARSLAAQLETVAAIAQPTD